VHIVTSEEIWDEKIAEANRDGKMVSTVLSNGDAHYVAV
jgi:hypothetical protein